MLPVSKALADRFAELDPANAATYRARQAAFAVKWQAALSKWAAEAAPLRGQPIAVQHRSWVYLENWLGVRRVIALEPKPGVPPSSGYLAQVLEVLKKTPVKMIIRAAYEDGRPSESSAAGPAFRRSCCPTPWAAPTRPKTSIRSTTTRSTAC